MIRRRQRAYRTLCDSCKAVKAPQHSQYGAYCSLIQRASEAIYIFDAATWRVLDANQVFLDMLGLTAQDLQKLSIEDFIVDRQQDIATHIRKVLRDGVIALEVRKYRHKNGRLMFVEVWGERVRRSNSRHIVVYVRDITSRRHIENRLRLASQIFESALDGILVTDAEGVIQFANPAFLQTTGYRLEEILGVTPRILKSGVHDESFYKEMWDALNRTGQWSGEIWNKRKNGDIYPEWLVVNAIKNEVDHVTMYACIYRDLTERMRYEEKIRHQAYHDGLTGLANRSLFTEQLRMLLALGRREKRHLAVLFIDLDGFKYVNDHFGHAMGDLLLVEVAQRLQHSVRSSDIVARMGGDEFTLILPDIRHWDSALQVAEKLQRLLAEPFELQDVSLQISCSIGISFYPEHGQDVDVLLNKADYAMYTAKMAGKNAYRVWQEEAEES